MVKRQVLSLISLGLFLAACGQAPQGTNKTTGPNFDSNALIEEGAITAQADTLKILAPGVFKTVSHIIPINVVFVGYDQGDGAQQLNLEKFKAGLPKTYTAVERIPTLYKQFNENNPNAIVPSGQQYRYNYSYTVANKKFEDAFFAYLGSIASPQAPTLFQVAYNCQYIPDADNPPCTTPAVNIAKTIGQNHYIDAPSVEKWLSNNAESMIGVNTRQYTVFAVNWYGRNDYKDHVYTKIGEPDPDTGYDFGAKRSSRKITAWGGTPTDDAETGSGKLSRLWFFDLSAGPESSASSWNITDKDIDADENPDYRMPPIWEYGSEKRTYRKFDDLSGDLAKITRFVALDILFTTSPIYAPGITKPVLPDNIKVDFTNYEGDPTTNVTNLYKTSLMNNNWSQLQPLSTFSTTSSAQPFTGDTEAAYRCYTEQAPATKCYLEQPAFAAVFLNNLIYQYPGILARKGNADYVIPGFTYSITDDYQVPFLGLADDDFLTGAQSFVYGVISPGVQSIGYGITTTMIHEVGHHLGMSHPHDGYDSELNTDFGTTGDYAYSWLGDYSNSIMSYIDVNDEFSQFDRDNMARYMASNYINNANRVVKLIYDAGKAEEYRNALEQADTLMYSGVRRYWFMHYADGAAITKRAYKAVLDIAKQAGVSVKPDLWQTAYLGEEGGVGTGRRPDLAAAKLADKHALQEKKLRYATDVLWKSLRNRP